MTYDAVVIGSGACGGTAAHELTQAGLNVLVLEAGRAADPARDVERRPPWDRDQPFVDPRRPVQSTHWYCDERARYFFVDDLANPYSTPADAPFLWYRGRIAGGRTHLWGRSCIRMSEEDLRDWPVSYVELAPFYEKIERQWGVAGDETDVGPVTAALRPRLGEAFPGRRFTHCRHASAVADGTFPRYTSLRAAIQPALATGRLTLRTDAVVREILRDPRTGLAQGVECADAETKESFTVKAKHVVLAASAYESVRLLLNSGFENDALGAYLTDHLSVDIAGSLPAGFADGSFTEFSYVPNIGAANCSAMMHLYFDEKCREPWFWARLFGEVKPRAGNRLTLDPEKRDAWGVPAARIQFRYGGEEDTIYREGKTFLYDLAKTVGAEVRVHPAARPIPGTSVHEVGGARMGQSPRDSVLNPYHQVWDAENVLVVDGASFRSCGTQPPTLTMMALAARACYHLVQRL